MVWPLVPVDQLVRWWCHFTKRVEKGAVGSVRHYTNDLAVRSWLEQHHKEAHPPLTSDYRAKNRPFGWIPASDPKTGGLRECSIA
jgi:hypothetical protein